MTSLPVGPFLTEADVNDGSEVIPESQTCFGNFLTCETLRFCSVNLQSSEEPPPPPETAVRAS